MAKNLKSIGIIVNPNSGKDIRRLVASASSVSSQHKSNELVKVYEGISKEGINKVYIMPDFSDISRKSREKYSNLIETEIIKTSSLDEELTTIEAAKKMEKLDLSCIIVFGGDGTARLVSNYVKKTPILPISTGTNNLFPENIDGTVAGMVAGKYSKIDNKNFFYERVKKLDVYFENKLVDSALVDIVSCKIPYVGARAIWEMDSISEIFVNKISPYGIGFSSIGFNLGQSLDKYHSMYIDISNDQKKCSKKIYAPIAPGKIEEILINNWKLFKKNEIINIRLKKGTLALDGERRIEFSDNNVNIRINHNGPKCLKIKEILSN